jgi:hypothetical protein
VGIYDPFARPPVVDPNAGLGLAEAPWPPPEWGLAPEQAVGGLPAPAPPALVPEQWPPPEWDQPAALGAVQEQLAPAADDFALERESPYVTAQEPLPEEEPLFPWDAPEGLAGVQAGLQQDPYAEPQPASEVDPELASEQLLAQGPEAIAAEGARQQQTAEDFAATRVLDEDTKNRQWAERNAATWRVKETEIEAKRQERYQQLDALMKQGVNNDNWWATRNTGQKVASFVAAIAGGLVSPYYGGRNTGLEMINEAIEQDIESQKANLAHRRSVIGQQLGLLGEMASQNGDALQSEETLRIAAWQNVDQRIAAQAARLDPRGVGAQKLAVARQGARQKIAEAEAVADDRLLKRAQISHGMEMEEAKLAETRRTRAVEAAEKQRARVLDAKRAGLIYDASGNLVADPDVKAAPMKPEDQKKALELERMVEGAKVHDSRSQFVGEARRGVEGATKVADNVVGYEAFRPALANLMDRIAAAERTFGPTSSRWPSEEVAAINALKEPLVFNMARAMNGPGPLSKPDVDAARSSIPDLDTWTTSKKPQAVYDAVVEKVDRQLDAVLGVELKDFDPKKSPTTRYKALDRIRQAPDTAIPRETLLKEAATPLAPEALEDPTYRAAAIAGRQKALGEIANRGSVGDADVNVLVAAWDKQKAAGQLSAEEHAALTAQIKNWRTARLQQVQEAIPPVTPAGQYDLGGFLE